MPASLRRLLDPGDWAAVKPRLDPGATALEIRYTPGSAEYKLRIGVGLSLLAVDCGAVYGFRDDPFTIVILSGFGLFALLNVGYGILQSVYSLTLQITSSEVCYEARTLFGRRQWREWLNCYRGVRLRESQLPDSDVDSIRMSRTFHIVELAHEDAARTVALHVQEGGAPPREIQEAFARRFGLAALAPDGAGEAARLPAELDRSLRRQRAPCPDPGPPCAGVKVRQEGGVTRLTIELTPAGKALAWLYWILLPVGSGALVYQLDPLMGYLAAAMAAVFVLVLLGAARLMGGRKEENQRAILIDGGRVWIERPSMGDDRIMKFMTGAVSRLSGLNRRAPREPLDSLPRGAIEQVRVDQWTSHDSGGPGVHPRLVIEADVGSLEYIGAQFDRRKLEWIRDYLRFRLASGT